MIKNRKVALLSKWDEKDDMICACLALNPLCQCTGCEELEVTIKPYEDIESCLRNKRGYKRHRGALRQR
ncbi:MAG: hypothetical protein ACRC30_11015 [Clostridium sp.]